MLNINNNNTFIIIIIRYNILFLQYNIVIARVMFLYWFFYL